MVVLNMSRKQERYLEYVDILDIVYSKYFSARIQLESRSALYFYIYIIVLYIHIYVWCFKKNESHVAISYSNMENDPFASIMTVYVKPLWSYSLFNRRKTFHNTRRPED